VNIPSSTPPPPPRRPASAAAGEPAAPAEAVLLYQAGPKIQPRRADGRYARLRVFAMFALLGLYYALPWISWHGQQLVLFDLPHRRFYLFGLTLVPQDLPLLAAMLFTAALTLFLFTSLAGRLWCGYSCPQTVWTEAFLWLEYFTEGDRHARMKLDKPGWTFNKIVRRGGKHLAWALFAAMTGVTFVAYFVPARELIPAAFALQLSGWSLFWCVFYSFATWGNAGFLREQVCKYMCPYARFQSAMFDRDTLIIAYNEKRGEPRKHAAKEIGKPAGDCIDCSLCVQVCPTGIDIRKGLQYECIACAACIDVCDTVMDSQQRPHGLIHYTSANHDAGKKVRLLRPRTLGYGAVWLVACVVLLTLIVNHSTLYFDIMRDRHTLYRELASGAIENLYVVDITNGDNHAHNFMLSARLEDGTVLEVEPTHLQREPGQTAKSMVSLRIPHETVEHGNLPPAARIVVTLTPEDKPEAARSHSARFLTGD
jgi:cytochrome c oxidase accessory protein FixG